MKKRTSPKHALRSLLAGAALATFTVAGTVQAEQCENPDSLTFAMIPAEDSVKQISLYQGLVEHLKKETGKSIEFYMPTSYATVMEALIGGWSDIAVLGPYSYVIAKEKAPDNVEVFATYAKRKGHLQAEGPGYQAALVTRKDSGLTSIESLEGKIVGLVDPASTSGNLLPRVVFANQLTKQFDDYFSRVVYTGGHDLSALAVKEGKVDTAFVATHRFDGVLDKGLASMDDYNVLWMSPAIPQDPFVYRSKLCDDLKAKIKGAFLSAHQAESAKAYLDNVHSNRFIAMSDADYNIIRDLKKAKDSSKAK